MAQWSPEFAGADPVVAALHALFQALQQQQEQEAAAAAAGSSSASAPPSAVPAKPSWAAAAGGSGASAPASPANHSWAAAAGGSGDSAPASPANPSWAAAVGGVSQSAQAQQKGSGQERAPVDPTPLREALEEMEGRSFKQGVRQSSWGCNGVAGGVRRSGAGRLHWKPTLQPEIATRGEAMPACACPAQCTLKPTLILPLRVTPAGEMQDAGEVMMSIYEKVGG